MTDQQRGNREILDAIAAISDQPRADVEAVFRAEWTATDAGQPQASEDAVELGVRAVINRVNVAPALTVQDRGHHVDVLLGLLADIPSVTIGELNAWSRLVRHAPEAVPTLNRAPVEFPALGKPQEGAWHTLLDLEDDPSRTEPWVLVGGQMVFLHALENGLAPHRATDDGDIVLGVWTRRDALETTSRFLRQRDFEQVDTADGYGYRFKRDATMIDLLLPEGLERQAHRPRTATGRPGLAVDGGNQALIRAERVPVTVAGRTGHVRRPDVLGALVAKSCAFVADNRDSHRHAEDIVVLGEITLDGLRVINDRMSSKDRKRLRKALVKMRETEYVWLNAADPHAVRTALYRLANLPA